MLFGNRRVVEEELERIRLANLPPAREEIEDETAAFNEDVIESDVISVDVETEAVEVIEPVETVEIGFTAKDVLAMIIAAFSLILPYALIMIVVTILFVLFFFRG